MKNIFRQTVSRVREALTDWKMFRQRNVSLAVGVSTLLLFSTTGLAAEKSRLVTNLEAGRKQTIVAYGTSLTAVGAWVKQLSAELNRRYPDLATVINSGEPSKWSKWGVKHLKERVINQKPDVVFIEFSINDADLHSDTSVAEARSNLETMIDRILSANKSCEIILMVMNPPIGIRLEGRPHIESYNQVYRDVAAERHLMLIDHDPNWQKVLKEDPNLFSRYVPDGLHPNYEGSAAVITPEILSALGMKTRH